MYLFVVGSPRIAGCRHRHVHHLACGPQGEEVELDASWEARYTQAYESLGGMGERVLGFAFKNMKGFSMDYPFTNKPEPNFPLNDLTFCGLFSMIDPPKEGVPEAVAKCKRARIKVYMVTGEFRACIVVPVVDQFALCST